MNSAGMAMCMFSGKSPRTAGVAVGAAFSFLLEWPVWLVVFLETVFVAPAPDPAFGCAASSSTRRTRLRSPRPVRSSGYDHPVPASTPNTPHRTSTSPTKATATRSRRTRLCPRSVGAPNAPRSSSFSSPIALGSGNTRSGDTDRKRRLDGSVSTMCGTGTRVTAPGTRETRVAFCARACHRLWLR